MKTTAIGLDLAKCIFQAHGVDAYRPGCGSQVTSPVADAAIFAKLRGPMLPDYLAVGDDYNVCDV
jgi:hypothetical protein